MDLSVSVIVTCFNLESYIGAAIESVLKQEFAGEVEVIVVDDCSTDGSADIIKTCEGIRYVRTPRNSGVLLATLIGIEASSGELLLFLDGDDIWEPRKIAAVVDRFDADPALALVTHDLRFIDRDGHSVSRRSRPEEELRSIPADIAEAKLRAAILTMGDYVWLGSAFAVKRTLARMDEFATWARTLPDPANSYQDWPLAFWAASIPRVRLGYVDQKLFAYRLHEANYSGDVRTAEGAARNFRRSFNTVDAMLAIARQRDLPKTITGPLERRAVAYSYLADLYRGRRWNALRGFVSALPDFRRRHLVGKELIRLAGVQLLGPDRFTGLAAGRKIMRATPTS